MRTPTLRHALAAEALGSALLLIVVVGSGIMGERLAAGNTAVALLANSLATGCGLVVLIVIFGPLSGAHFNPAVSAVFAARGALPVRHVVAYLPAQVLGALAGVAVAHAMFELPIVQTSQHLRTGGAQWFGEFVATFGLVLTILGSLASRPGWTPLLVAAYITGAYWFTSSTSFANPAVTVARAFTDSFAGIAPAHVAGFVTAQVFGAASGALAGHWLWPSAPSDPEPSA